MGQEQPQEPDIFDRMAAQAAGVAREAGVALQLGEEHIDTQDGDAHWRFTVPQVALDGAQLAHREWEL